MTKAMKPQTSRRRFLGSIAAGAGALALSGPRAFAQVNFTAGRDARLLALAREQLALRPGKFWKQDYVGISDFGLHSALPRFHFVDLVNNRVESFHVSHGTGSDWEHDGWLKRYSNVEGTEATSKGAFLTRSWYTGKYGTSIRLDGLDPTNSNALPRAIVMHPAEYAKPDHIGRWGKLGRSNGCFAMGPEQFKKALIVLSGGRMLYADSLSLAPNGSTTPGPVPQLQPLIRQRPDGTFERTNPGVY